MGISKPKVNKGLMRFLQLTIIGTSVIFIVTRIIDAAPTQASSDLLRSMNLETQETLSEQCMDMMEEIRLLLLEDDLDSIEYYRCPLHDQPYVVTFEGDTITVSDPDPGLHGFRVMSVSNKNPDLILVN